MNIFVIGASETQKKICSLALLQLGPDFTISFHDNTPQTHKVLSSTNIDFILSFNLAGFNFLTLTGNVWYNLLPCRQMHIIDNPLTDSSFLSRPYSIAMFFYCTQHSLYEKIHKDCPELPNLFFLDQWGLQPAKVLANTILEILSQ